MKWWIATCIVQTMYLMLPPIRHWYAHWRTYRCWKSKCTCRSMFSFQDLPPNIKMALKDQEFIYSFINSSWNFVERKQMSVQQRQALDLDKYFNGVRGPR